MPEAFAEIKRETEIKDQLILIANDENNKDFYCEDLLVLTKSIRYADLKLWRGEEIMVMLHRVSLYHWLKI